MRRHRLRGIGLMIVGLCAAAGCTSGPFAKEKAPQTQVTNLSPIPPLNMGDPNAKKEPELSATEGAELNLAVAAKFDEAGRELEAIAHFERARSMNPKVNVSKRLAVLYDRVGENRKALAEYQLAIQAHPKDADLLNDLGYFHLSRDNFVEAEKQLRACLQINPNHQRAWTNLGMALGYQKKFNESYDAFVKVVSPAEAHVNIGVILIQWSAEEPQQSQHKEQARGALQQALTLDPNLHKAQTLMAFLDDPKAIYNDPHAKQPKPSKNKRPLENPLEKLDTTSSVRPLSSPAGPLSRIPGKHIEAGGASAVVSFE